METNRFLKFEKEIRHRVNAQMLMRLKHDNDGYVMAADFVKRKTFYLRPALTIIAARLFGASERKAMLPSIAIQLSNEWMLIHDDIEDGSDFRRHGPALHKVQGEAIAINTGDYLHSEAWGAIADYILEYGARDGKRLQRKFSDIIRKTIVAQAMDLGFSRNIKDLSKVNNDYYYKIASGKGAYYSVYGPLQLGAIVAGRPDNFLSALKSIGEPAGIAAQIQNDILDLEEGYISSRGYQDLKEGKLTLMVLHAFGSASTKEREKINEVYAKEPGKKSSQDIEFLLNVIKKRDGIAFAVSERDRLGRIADAAFRKHEESFPNNRFKGILEDAIRSQYKAYQHT